MWTNSFTWTPARDTGLSAPRAPYILINFPTATAVTVTGAKPSYGTIYAPRAAVHDAADGDANGAVIADSYVHGGRTGETAGIIAAYPFARSPPAHRQALTIDEDGERRQHRAGWHGDLHHHGHQRRYRPGHRGDLHRLAGRRASTTRPSNRVRPPTVGRSASSHPT